MTTNQNLHKIHTHTNTPNNLIKSFFTHYAKSVFVCLFFCAPKHPPKIRSPLNEPRKSITFISIHIHHIQTTRLRTNVCHFSRHLQPPPSSLQSPSMGLGSPTDQSLYTTAIDPEIKQSVIKLESDIKKTIDNNNQKLKEVQSEFEHLLHDKQNAQQKPLKPQNTDLLDIADDDDDDDEDLDDLLLNRDENIREVTLGIDVNAGGIVTDGNVVSVTTDRTIASTTKTTKTKTTKTPAPASTTTTTTAKVRAATAHRWPVASPPPQTQQKKNPPLGSSSDINYIFLCLLRAQISTSHNFICRCVS